jgi:hypothetical protein
MEAFVRQLTESASMLKGLASRRAAALSAVAIGVAAGAAGVPAAQAGVLTPNACAANSAMSQPFVAWGDANEYRLLPGGDFTAGAPGWTLSGGAAIAGTGDPFALTGVPSENSLSLPVGASAQSPFTCVDATQPTFRFLDTADAPGSAVAVSVVYESVAGPIALPVGTITADNSWQPSAQYRSGAAIAGLLHGGTAEMAVSFTALSGATRVDDVFVDPRMSWVS